MSKFKAGDKVVVMATVAEVDSQLDLVHVICSDYTRDGNVCFADKAIVPESSVTGLAEDTAIRNTLQARANKRQVDGNHYQTRGIQPWDYIAANALDWFQGEIIKYVTRWRDKGKMNDLQKAHHVLEKYIEVETSIVP